MKKKRRYRVILQPAEEGGYTVFVPALLGCISEGDTKKEALANIEEAIQGWIEVSRTYGDTIPPSDIIEEMVEVAV
jgi:predicted RNase H-like HicB family nuclease